MNTTLWAIISDIHANELALDAVLKDIDVNFPDSNLIVLGDIVGYGSRPRECLQKIFNRKPQLVLQGNHDVGAVALANSIAYSKTPNPSVQRLLMELHHGELTAHELDKLDNLPAIAELSVLPNIIFAHNSPENPLGILPGYAPYISKTADADAEQTSLEGCFCIHGHSHLPGVFYKANERVKLYDIYFTEKIEHCPPIIARENLLFVNPGSVGQPDMRQDVEGRKFDPRASYMVMDNSNPTAPLFRFRRVHYDVNAFQEQLCQKYNAQLSILPENRWNMHIWRYAMGRHIPIEYRQKAPCNR